MMLRDYFEMGWVVVAVCCGYEDEECEAYEIDEAEHRVYVRVRDEDD